MPWDVIPWDPTIHLGLFVHRVDGLEPGLYLLVRDPRRMGRLRAAMHARFEWSMPPGCPAELPLRLLEAGDVRRLATQVSCHQDIAGDGAFSLAMIAEYQETLFTRGAWFYRRLFWETGADRAGPVSRSRSGRRAGHWHRLLLRRSGAQGVRARRSCLPVALSLHGRRAGRRPPPDDAGTVCQPRQGMPFPLGLASVEAGDARLVPWAWGINGWRPSPARCWPRCWRSTWDSPRWSSQRWSCMGLRPRSVICTLRR